MKNQVFDEVLEAIWRCREQNQDSISACLEVVHAEADIAILQQMEKEGLVVLQGEKIKYTEDGEHLAKAIIRRHRLAERMFTDVLDIDQEQSELAACTFEHTVVPEVTEGLCTLLGHPHECPHGKAIPPGACCREGRVETKAALLPLSEVACGITVRVAYIRPRHHDHLHLMLSVGIAPGVPVRVHQRTPVLVVEAEQSEFAMDREIADDVYVWMEPQAT